MRASYFLILVVVLAGARSQETAPATTSGAAVPVATSNIVAAKLPEKSTQTCLSKLFNIIKALVLQAISLYYAFSVIMGVFLQCVAFNIIGQYLNLKFITNAVVTGLLGVGLMLPNSIISSATKTLEEIGRPLNSLLSPILGPVLNPLYNDLLVPVLTPVLKPLTEITGHLVNGVKHLAPLTDALQNVLGGTIDTVNKVPIVGSITQPVGDIVGGALNGVLGIPSLLNFG